MYLIIICIIIILTFFKMQNAKTYEDLYEIATNAIIKIISFIWF